MAPKKKAEKMSLNDFLGNADFGSWADEMEDFPTAPAPRAGEERGGSALSRAPDRGDRNYPPREELPLPTAPPYTAFVGNLPFDVTEGDLEAHFKGSEVKSVKIIKDREEKPKGFGYVEFATLDGLKSGLALSQSSLAGRSIRVSVADPPKEREGGRGFGSSSGGGFDDDRQWRRDGPLPPRDDDRRGFGRPGGGRFSEDGGERGERGERAGFGSKFQSREPAAPSIAEETNDWRSNMRASAPPPPQHDKPRFGGGFGGERFGAGAGGSGEVKRRGSGLNTPTNATFESPRLGPADVEEKWNIGSKFKPSQSQSSPERPNEGGDRGTFGRKFGGENRFSSDAADPSDDIQDWRSAPRKVVSGSNTPAMGGGAGFGKGGSMERSPSTSGPPPRRKLDLLPKTNAPADGTTSIGSPKSGEATPASATSTKPNPFGAAKPVDAAAREREISEKMERAKLTATPQQTTSSLAFSRSSSRAGSRQGSRAGSPTRSPRPSALGLGGMGSNAPTPTSPVPPKILSRQGSGPQGGRGGSFSHGRVGSVGMSPRMTPSEPEGNWRRGSAPTVNPTNNANASSAGPAEGGSTSAATPERRPSTIRSNFSFANAAAGSTRTAATPPPGAKPVLSEQAEAATAES